MQRRTAVNQDPTRPDGRGFVRHELPGGCLFYVGNVPEALMWDAAAFEAAWRLRPAEKHRIKMFGEDVETPRHQQAFGADYYYTGRVNRALPMPPLLEPLLAWARDAIDARCNGTLLNWYEGPGHYIGPHHDSTRGMAAGAPIVTASFGETRTFRLSRGKGPAAIVRDFPAPHGTVFVMPYETNRVWKHAVPRSATYRGRRISVTFRAFTGGVLAHAGGGRDTEAT
jgi:alkylated DNA repair dioxygenase AlkB